MRPLLTGIEAAAVLSVSGRTLENMRQRGLGPKFVKVGSKVLYSAEDLQEYIRARTFRSTSEYDSRKGAACA